MELSITAALRPLVPEHRPHVPEAGRSLVQQAVLDRGPHHARGVLGSHRQRLAVQRVDEAVHLFFDDVGHLSEPAPEQGRRLQDRGANLRVAVALQGPYRLRLERLPERSLRGQQIVHAAHGGNLR